MSPTYPLYLNYTIKKYLKHSFSLSILVFFIIIILVSAMYTISKNNQYELIEKNSKFIALLYKIDNPDISEILNNIKNKYPDATHYCYAYIVDNIKKSSDDGEPSGTAGTPILKVLESNNLTNILCVVVRYFGGIKLGANGLIRAYTKSTANALKDVILKELQDGYNLNITFPYQVVKEVDYLLKDVKINHKTFDDLITYNIDINKDFLQTITRHQLKYEIINNTKIEK